MKMKSQFVGSKVSYGGSVGFVVADNGHNLFVQWIEGGRQLFTQYNGFQVPYGCPEISPRLNFLANPQDCEKEFEPYKKKEEQSNRLMGIVAFLLIPVLLVLLIVVLIDDQKQENTKIESILNKCKSPLSLDKAEITCLRAELKKRF